LGFWVPFSAKPNATTYARFRFSSTSGGLPYDGPATDGEVEDYEVYIEKNEMIKWIQLPDMTKNGIDIKVTGQWLADDFECTSHGLITDVHLWCSWKGDAEGVIDRVHLSFHSDDPVGPGGSDPSNDYSKPDELLWHRDFVAHEFVLTRVATLPEPEWWWDPVWNDLIYPGDSKLYRLDIYIDPCDAFVQQGDPCEPVIYWMDVRVDTLTGELGWKTRRYPEHFQDDAVFHWGELPFAWQELRYPTEHPYDGNTIDMAFVLTGITPKPPVPNLKWSQPPIEFSPWWDEPIYCGWNEPSWTKDPFGGPEPNLGVADDFRCIGTMPVGSIHFWGSYIGWAWPEPPPVQPIRWWFRFWSNVPADSTADPCYSHPGEILWDIMLPADRVKTEWVGWDQFPDMPFEACFQHYVEFKEDEYFWQHDYVEDTNDQVFWLNIMAIYPNDVDLTHPWGWKTRPWSWMDDAVTYECRYVPPVCRFWPIEDPIWGESYDVAFELDTDPCYVKWEQPFTGMRHWPHYEDENSVATATEWTELKWQQPPNPDGWDVCLVCQEIGDDFKCNETGPIDDIHFWISYQGDDVGPVPADWDISIWSDAVGQPGARLWTWNGLGRVNTYLDGTGLQGWYCPSNAWWVWPDHYTYYKVDIDEITDPFIQQFGRTYWLVIKAKVPVTPPVGWKTSWDHWGRDGVYRDTITGTWTPLTDPCTGETLDMAFELTTEKEQVDTIRMVADDWPCDSNRPVTAIAWWGSYIGYQYEPCTTLHARPPKPDYFLLQIWTDVPAGADPAYDFSHPNDVLWKYKAYDYDEVLVGYDKHPIWFMDPPREPVFRYSVKLPCQNWFFQKDGSNIYWLSIVAVYKDAIPSTPWGWTNHKWVFMDDAVAGYPDPGGVTPWRWQELYNQTGHSTDMSFQIFTDPNPILGTCWDICQCPCQPQGDCTCDGLINLADLFCLKAHFGKCAPWTDPECCADFTQNGCVNLGDLFALKAGFGLVCPLPSTGSQTCP
jgi:hypothetical protein